MPTPTPDRIAALRTDAMDRHGSWVRDGNPFAADVALWRARQQGGSRVQQRAAFLLELVRCAPMEIYPLWRLAGEHLAEQRFTSPRLSVDDCRAMQAFGVVPGQIEEIRQAIEAWHARGGGAAPYVAVGEETPGMGLGRGAWGATTSETVFWASGWVENHSIRDYAKVLRLGFEGIRREIEDELDHADLADPDYPRKENFWRAAVMVCDAGIELGGRYAALARERAAAAADPADAARLEQMADICSRVPRHGAASFFEAAQSLWFAHILTCGEDSINANSIGRLDQILLPWYQADIEAGVLDREGAREIMEELACKLYLDYDVQAITLGGVDAAGRCAVNDLTYVILEATRRVGVIRDLSLRVSRRSPERLLRQGAEMIAAGGGIPFLFNDDCFIKALTDRGIELSDARDYAPIGCIELTIPGRANPHAVSGWFNSTKCLELALFDGCDPETGKQLGPATGRLTDHRDFESLLAAYRTQVETFVHRLAYHCNRGELAQREQGPLPCWSVLTEACVERGRDITDGGAVYNYHSICFLGTANTADSLIAIKHLVYRDGRVEAGDLLSALQGNFEGREPLRKMLLTQAPKYGNDEEEVDLLAGELALQFIGLLDRLRSPLGGRYVAHLFSFLCNIGFGRGTGATPDGRKAGEPLAYSLSAHQGRDERGVTALLQSLARLPHDQAAGATAAIVELDPKVVEGRAGIDRLVQLIRAAIEMGVGQLQWNVVTAERLRQAQEDPERYGNIPVRVAGYSQMFRLVDRELQDHIIARTKHTQ